MRKQILQAGGVSWKGHYKRLRLWPTGKMVSLPLSACVTKGEQIVRHGGELHVVCTNGRATICGPYVRWEHVAFGAAEAQIAAKEVTEEAEHVSCQRLADLHYRGKQSHGRTARLVLRAYDQAFPTVLGYVELATPLFVNKARSQVLDAPFHQGAFSWERWNISAEELEAATKTRPRH